MAVSTLCQDFKVSNETIALHILKRDYISKEELFGLFLKQNKHIMDLCIELFCVDENNSHFDGIEEGTRQMLVDAKNKRMEYKNAH